MTGRCVRSAGKREGLAGMRERDRCVRAKDRQAGEGGTREGQVGQGWTGRRERCRRERGTSAGERDGGAREREGLVWERERDWQDRDVPRLEAGPTCQGNKGHRMFQAI